MWSGCDVVRDRALATEFVWAELVNSVAVRVDGLVLVKQRNIATLLVGARGRANDRDIAWEHKVLNEPTAQPENALDHGDKGPGRGGHVECFLESGRQQG